MDEIDVDLFPAVIGAGLPRLRLRSAQVCGERRVWLCYQAVHEA